LEEGTNNQTAFLVINVYVYLNRKYLHFGGKLKNSYESSMFGSEAKVCLLLCWRDRRVRQHCAIVANFRLNAVKNDAFNDQGLAGRDGDWNEQMGVTEGGVIIGEDSRGRPRGRW
jgi:hypothetical protein